MKLSDFAPALLDSAKPTPDGVVDPQGRPAGKRFDVYRNNVVHSLSEALTAAYPVVEKLVGPKFFKAMANVFVRQFPPRSPLMFLFAPELPSFLESFPPVANLPYLPDVARLELYRRQAYNAADALPIDGAVLAVASPEQLMGARLTLHPTMRILQSNYPVFSIWQNNSETAQVILPSGGQDILIARPEAELQMRTLPAGGADFLKALQDNQPLAQAAEIGAKTDGFDLTENIGGILASQILIKTTLEGI
ncbi:MAG: putative DNA-binding domain-containing protein [Rhodobacteraceae bacterium]|nr:putative DNA-binding domain-containing protein [Paracoccaceae bacterium]